MDLTDASNNTTKFDVRGGTVNQVMFFSQLKLKISFWNSCVAETCPYSSSHLVPMKLVELSLYISHTVNLDEI